MNHKEIIHSIQNEMKKFFTQETTGHDWYHIERVWKNAKKISVHYPEANQLQIELAALLHDRYDHKIVSNVEEAKLEVRDLLLQHGLPEDLIKKILYSIDAVGFRNGKNPLHPISIEDKIVQDADRLDAIGAIGIARAMVYSGHTGRPIHDPGLKPRKTMTLEEYRNEKSSAIMHFYEKLLKLKDGMHTTAARELAKGRHRFLEMYLEEFYDEWDARK